MSDRKLYMVGLDGKHDVAMCPFTDKPCRDTCPSLFVSKNGNVYMCAQSYIERKLTRDYNYLVPWEESDDVKSNSSHS